MHDVIVTMKQPRPSSLSQKPMGVNICSEWDLNFSQSFFPARSEIAVGHVDAHIFAETTNTSEVLKGPLTDKTTK